MFAEGRLGGALSLIFFTHSVSELLRLGPARGAGPSSSSLTYVGAWELAYSWGDKAAFRRLVLSGSLQTWKGCGQVVRKMVKSN